MFTQTQFKTPREALVCRGAKFGEQHDQYLQLTDGGDPVWTSDPHVATSFSSLTEAARMAFRLPAAVKAYGVLREPELTLLRSLH